MARGRYNRRRRRGRLSFVWRLLAALVIIVAVVAAVILFFRMNRIVVIGNERYTEQEVLEASGITPGGNLYLVNKYAVKEAIFARLPYAEEVRIDRRLPDTLVIEIHEGRITACVESDGGFWLLSEQGNLLEETDTVPEGCPVISGAPLAEPAAGHRADFGEDAAYRANVAMTLLREAEERRMRAGIARIDLSDDTALRFEYLDRFSVRFPWTADVAYKLESLSAVVSYLENNETGRIDLMTDGKASFIPR